MVGVGAAELLQQDHIFSAPAEVGSLSLLSAVVLVGDLDGGGLGLASVAEGCEVIPLVVAVALVSIANLIAPCTASVSVFAPVLDAVEVDSAVALSTLLTGERPRDEVPGVFGSFS